MYKDVICDNYKIWEKRQKSIGAEYLYTVETKKVDFYRFNMLIVIFKATTKKIVKNVRKGKKEIEVLH